MADFSWIDGDKSHRRESREYGDPDLRRGAYANPGELAAFGVARRKTDDAIHWLGG